MASIYPNTLSASNDMYTSYSDAYDVTPSIGYQYSNINYSALLGKYYGKKNR